MSEKVSTITLRLTAEEAAQLEILKDIPPFLYPLQAGSEGTRRTETKVPGAGRSRAGFSVGTRQVGESGQGERVGETIASKIRSGRSWPMKYLLADVSGSCARAA